MSRSVFSATSSSRKSAAASRCPAAVESGGEKVEVDVALDGAILQTEQAIPLDQIPANVMTAFGAKYPDAKPTRAEKQVRTGKGAFYEIKFAAEPKAKEATFAEEE